MIKAEAVERAIATGLSAVCAWCEHWHAATDRGEEVECGKNCGGPALGMGFPMYKGPMEGYLHEFCYICGKSASSSVDISGRLVGVCNRMGPKRETCLDKLRVHLTRRGVVIAKEIVVPAVGGKSDDI